MSDKNCLILSNEKSRNTYVVSDTVYELAYYNKCMDFLYVYFRLYTIKVFSLPACAPRLSNLCFFRYYCLCSPLAF